jgi:hypothetical protein
MERISNKDFLVERDHTGREIVFYPETGKQYNVEYIGGRSNWGDINPATGKVEGNYGGKYKGSIREEDSLITESNGFNKDEIYEGKGTPYAKIDSLHNEWKKENGYG